MKNRLLNIDGVINFRDIGGYQGLDGAQVVYGKAYRSAQLDRISAKGVSEMSALGIKTVVDLRFSDESERYPTVVQAFPEAEFISWQSELTEGNADSAKRIKRGWRDSLDSGDPTQVREAMRINYPAKLYSHKGVYRTMLQRLIVDDAPLVFHCAAGKDRTGVAAALILGLLGVSNGDIVEDYLVSQSQVAHLFESWVTGGATDYQHYDDFQQRMRQYPRELVQPVFDADANYIKTLLTYVDKTYQGFEQYAMQVLDLGQSELNELRARLLV